MMYEMEISVSQRELNEISKKLESISGKQPMVMKQAVNDAAKKIRSRLGKATGKRYATEKRVSYLSEMKIKTAKVGNLEAEISAKSKWDGNVFDFKVSPREFLTGGDRPKYFTGRVLKSSGMKKLEENGFKAFVIKFNYKNKQTGEEGETLKVVRRKEKKKRSVTKLMSPNMAQMLNTTASLPEVQADANKILRECLDKHIQKVLEGK